MYVKITIDMNNATFQNGENGTEVAHILRYIVTEVVNTELDKGVWLTLRDTNGAVVGKFEVKEN